MGYFALDFDRDKMYRRETIAVAWSGLPFYAARLLKEAVHSDRITVLATPGPQSKEQIEQGLGSKVSWLDPNGRETFKSLEISTPGTFLVSGWNVPQFNRLSDEARRAGASIVLMSDNSRKHTVRQALGSIAFRCGLRSKYSGALVPGNSGRDLLQFYGFPPSRIVTGMYGADSTIFTPGPSFQNRKRDFLFVGQFIARKGLRGLIESKLELRRSGTQVTIAAIGAGPMESELRAAGIQVLPFASAALVAAEMRDSRFLILPSLEDHWGVVVHEAACSGCGLILSDGVGAAHDLLTRENGRLFAKGNPHSLARAIQSALKMTNDEQELCLSASLRLSFQFGPAQFTDALRSFIVPKP